MVDAYDMLQALLRQGEEFETTIDVTANSTEQFNLTGFPTAEAKFVFIELIAESGTTDTDLTIHEDTQFDLSDMIFRATGISINDNEPTGGEPAGISGLSWSEANGNATLHVETTENSGTDGTIRIKIRWVPATEV